MVRFTFADDRSNSYPRNSLSSSDRKVIQQAARVVVRVSK